MKHNLLITASALAALTALSAPAQAARTLAPNYTFADGTKGYAFATPGEIVPCVYVGFVALGEGRGFPAPTLNLGNARSPLIHLEPSAGNSYGLIFAFGGGGGTGRLASPPAPIRGLSHLTFDTGSRARPHVVDLNFQITGPGDVNSWAAFNPGPMTGPASRASCSSSATGCGGGTCRSGSRPAPLASSPSSQNLRGRDKK